MNVHSWVMTAAFLLTASLALAQDAPPVDFSKFAPWTAKADEGDYLVGPPYADAPELKRRDDVPHGMVHRFTMNSSDSKMYPGIAKGKPGTTPYSRKVAVYVPAQAEAGKPLPFLISQDSMGQGELPTILDNMIADKRVPAMAAIFIDSGGGDAQGSQRGLEYDTVSGLYAEFVEKEVLPKASQEAKVTFTTDPDARMTMGGSSGAACAFTMAWFHPEWYHRVLSYSGTYVNQQSPPNKESPHGAWEYHENLLAKTRPKPIRLWMHVGENDNRSKDPASTLHNWVMANQRMAAVLKPMKYHYQFVFARDSGHVDGRVVKQTLPQALEWVWKGYKAK
jgi:enterochelin esterase family protein